jgi:hypothetical protein
MMEESKSPVNIDVSAEQKVFSAAITESQKQVQLAVTSQPDLPLPPPILFEPTQVLISETPVAQTAKVALDLRIKADMEDQISKLETQISGLQRNLSETINSLQSKWITDPKAKSNFDEKPTLEQNNLIFETRKEQFSDYPKWG